MTRPADCFSPSYAGARASFLHAAAERGGEILSHRHPLTGPDGAPLFLDEARFGARGARRVLFLASGTHGIEGFCGSAIQTFLLREGFADRLPDGVAVVLLHAVNPWGFAWLRRVNEDNVDINRNFLDHGAAHPENPDYDRLDSVLNPEHLDDAAVTDFLAAVQQFEREQGAEAVYRSLSGGQYRYPRGLQFGGGAAVWSNRVLRDVWARHAEAADLAAYVDLHSGLGPRGVGLLFQTARASSVEARLAHAWWPDVIRSEPAEGTNAALVSGLIGPAFTAAHGHTSSVAVVLEFGTRDMNEVMLTVQADNWLAQHGRRDSEVGRAIEQRMRDAFLIDEDDWKESVCRRAREVADRALAGMASFDSASAPTAEPRVRAAGPSDLDVLVEFARAMARETEDKELDPPTLRAGMTALLADANRGRVFVVECGAEVVATLSLTLEWSDWRNGFFWWIQSVYVHPEHRRRGHYRRLHDHVCTLASRRAEVFGLRLYVERENHAAQATYRVLGMEETDYLLFEQATRARN